MKLFNLLAESLYKIGSDKWLEQVIASLNVMWKGILAIFIVVGLIIISVLVLSAASGRKKKEKKEENSDNA